MAWPTNVGDQQSTKPTGRKAEVFHDRQSPHPSGDRRAPQATRSHAGSLERRSGTPGKVGSGVGDRSTSVGCILPPRGDFCRPRAGDTRRLDALEPQRERGAVHHERGRCYRTASIRSRAVRDHFAVSSSTRITFTGLPRSRCSRLQARWAKSIRYIVAHMQTVGERKRMVCSG